MRLLLWCGRSRLHPAKLWCGRLVCNLSLCAEGAKRNRPGQRPGDGSRIKPITLKGWQDRFQRSCCPFRAILLWVISSPGRCPGLLPLTLSACQPWRCFPQKAGGTRFFQTACGPEKANQSLSFSWAQSRRGRLARAINAAKLRVTAPAHLKSAPLERGRKLQAKIRRGRRFCSLSTTELCRAQRRGLENPAQNPAHTLGRRPFCGGCASRCALFPPAYHLPSGEIVTFTGLAPKTNSRKSF